MGRYLRPYLPGVAFHLTTRVQNKAHLFVPPLRVEIVRLLRRHLVRSDARLLAYVVMTNHLHLVLVQGIQRLDRLMQPFLRSAALATHAMHGTEGHVFERPFRDRVCRDEEHVRNAILYTHANPVVAGLCTDPAEYEWSSHQAYVGRRRAGPRPLLDLTTGLSAFMAGQVAERGHAKIAYREALEDVLGAHVEAPWPGRGNGDRSSGSEVSSVPSRPFLGWIADQVLAGTDGPVVGDLRTRWGRRSRLPYRAQVVLAASRVGYTGREIADFLGVSPSTISRDLAAARAPRPWCEDPVHPDTAHHPTSNADGILIN